MNAESCNDIEKIDKIASNGKTGLKILSIDDMDKSYFLTPLLLRLINTHKKKICYLTKNDITAIGIKLLSEMADLDEKKMQNGELSQVDIKNIIGKSSELSQLPVYFDSNSSTIDDIMKITVHMQDKHGINCLIIDDLESLSSNVSSKIKENNEAKIEHLKHIFDTLSILIIVINRR